MKLAAVVVFLPMLTFALSGASCRTRSPDDLDKLGTVRLTILERPFELWIADAPAEQTQGLMFVTTERMASLPDGTQRGMIFVFDHEQQLNFWMRNTIIPLDIAYLTTGGMVTAIHTMAPLDERLGQYPSRSPARYALEVNAGVFSDIGLTAGQMVTIPDSLLKRAP